MFYIKYTSIVIIFKKEHLNLRKMFTHSDENIVRPPSERILIFWSVFIEET